MSVTDPERVRALARLARLELAPDETARLVPELERILEAFAVLARHAPSGAEASRGAEAGAPQAGGLAATTILAVEARRRGDEPQPSLPRDRLLANAPEHADGFYAVPKTIGGAREP
jgi:aspartyl-tRNA(Asn)/glutamyl-tRNA(Gln) amidotransferase subunit C